MTVMDAFIINNDNADACQNVPWNWRKTRSLNDRKNAPLSTRIPKVCISFLQAATRELWRELRSLWYPGRIILRVSFSGTGLNTGHLV